MNARRLLLPLALVLAAAIPLAAQSAALPSDEGTPVMTPATGELAPLEPAPSGMSLLQAGVLGLVEGVTEYLPVSSTGHLAVAQQLMGLDRTPEARSASDAYAIVIQAGAIIAVLVVMAGRVGSMLKGLVGRDRDGARLLGSLAVAFVPAALIGLLLEDVVKRYLFGLWPIAGAWLAGGIFILAVLERVRKKDGAPLESLTWRTALVIGLAQVLALWPGVSRSLATISAALLAGLSAGAAVEFSFLLGLVTLGAATVYEGVKRGPEIVQVFGVAAPVLGFVVAGLAAFVAVRWFLGYLRTKSLAPFGWYRIVAALLAALLALR
jgi:undecaprenyl-diphosphatase